MFKRKSNATYEITVVGGGRTQTTKCGNRKEKDKWLYEYLINDEKWWAYEQYEKSPYSSFDKWFREFTKPQDFGAYQSIRTKTKTILIKKIL